MLSAKDLATFALAHINDGVGANGRRLLSAISGVRMRWQTAAWRGVVPGGFGLGWMTRHNGSHWSWRRRPRHRVVALCRSQARTVAAVLPKLRICRVGIPRDPAREGIAFRVRAKVRFYDTDSREDPPPVALRPIRDGQFTTGHGLSHFSIPGPDGRMLNRTGIVGGPIR